MTGKGWLAVAGIATVAIGVGLVVMNQTGPAPPGWNYCTDQAFYRRACEPAPYSRRYTGPPGYAGQICSAHTYAWRGDDGFEYPMMDGHPATGRYQRPNASAGPVALAKWDDCYVAHNPLAFGNGVTYPCGTTTAVGGTLTYSPLRLSQLPPTDRAMWSRIYHCDLITQTPTAPTPTLTYTPIPALCPTCAPTCNPQKGPNR